MQLHRRGGEFEAVSEASEEHGCPAIPVFCFVPIGEAQRRIRRQGEAAGPMAEDRDDELVIEVSERFREIPESTVELDAMRPVEELVEAVLGRLWRLARVSAWLGAVRLSSRLRSTHQRDERGAARRALAASRATLSTVTEKAPNASEKFRRGGEATYTATFTPEADGWIVAQVVEVPGAISQGRTIAEAKANVTEALELMLDWLSEEGQEIPAPAEVSVGPVTVSSR